MGSCSIHFFDWENHRKVVRAVMGGREEALKQAFDLEFRQKCEIEKIVDLNGQEILRAELLELWKQK